MDGILNINKAAGVTSHDVVASVRRILHQKRVGHAGTLDPAASVVLPIGVDQGTRVAEYLSESGKEYQAEIVFGVVTDTYDIEGAIVRTTDASTLTLERITQALPSFRGPQMQIPPRYSAIKIGGRPAYKLARAGAAPSLAARPIDISSLEVIAWRDSSPSSPTPRLTLSIACSKGTYIRSLAFDLGEQLGYGAHLGGLLRTRSGPFFLAQSITLHQLAAAATQGDIARHLFPADSALSHYPALHLDAPDALRILHGNPFEYISHDPAPSGPALARVYDRQGRLLAIAEWDGARQLWQPKKVFA
jgi:tRNA pseudouridine55 synthase